MAENRELMNKIYKDFNLTPNDVFAHKHYKIITRTGIDKIQAAGHIDVSYSLEHISFPDGSPFVIIKAYGSRFSDATKEHSIGTIETYGEASTGNNKNEYPVAMAEKRAMSRAVLKLAGLYEEGFFSEDEADDFKESVRKGRNAIGAGKVEVEEIGKKIS